MAKKVVDVKHHKKTSPSLPEVSALHKALAQGNYYVARGVAQRVLKAPDIIEADRNFADYALRMTWPDSGALLTGLACLAVTTIVAFLVSY